LSWIFLLTKLSKYFPKESPPFGKLLNLPSPNKTCGNLDDDMREKQTEVLHEPKANIRKTLKN
jgi:hypothetical protein